MTSIYASENLTAEISQNLSYPLSSLSDVGQNHNLTTPEACVRFAHVDESLITKLYGSPGVRKTDPETSHKAAQKAKTFRVSQATMILESLKQHGPMAACQLKQHTGLSVEQADRRRKEMVLAGLVRILPVEVDGCDVWEAV